MSNPLLNPYVRIGLAAAISEWARPKIVDHFVRITLEEGSVGYTADGARRDDAWNERLVGLQANMGVTAAVVSLVFVGLGMLGAGQTAKQAAHTGTVAGGGGAT